MRRNGNIVITGNCGMAAIRTSLICDDLPESLHKLRMDLEKVIPVGNSAHSDVPKFIENIWYKSLKDGYEKIEKKHPSIMAKKSSAFQLGTLGGGNHFIELCSDHEQRIWIMLHSGSRNIGNRIGTYFISEAMKEMERMFITLPDKNLAYFAEHTPMFNDYIEAVSWAQKYAMFNRQAMLDSVVTIMEKYFPNVKTNEVVVNCHHNYVEKEKRYLWNNIPSMLSFTAPNYTYVVTTETAGIILNSWTFGTLIGFA
jgi:tRNA-splicing ligase RtcB